MRLNECIGKTLLSADSGERLGRIEDVLLDPKRRQVVGVLVTDGVFSAQRVLPFEDIQTVGVDAVIAKTASTMCDAREWVHGGLPADRFQSLHGKHVVTANGARIGTVHDLVADELTGNVVALEITTDGRRNPGARLSLLHTRGNIALTNDIVVIPQDVVATRSK